jgi:hypothetical protein
MRLEKSDAFSGTLYGLFWNHPRLFLEYDEKLRCPDVPPWVAGGDVNLSSWGSRISLPRSPLSDHSASLLQSEVRRGIEEKVSWGGYLPLHVSAGALGIPFAVWYLDSARDIDGLVERELDSLDEVVLYSSRDQLRGDLYMARNSKHCLVFVPAL